MAKQTPDTRKRAMDKTAAYIRQIQKHYPHLAIETAILNQDGQYNDVLIVHHTADGSATGASAMIFRFAKVPDAVESLRREIELLHSLQNRLSLAIPNPIYHHVYKEDADPQEEPNAIGQVFAGYAMIPGQPLWSADVQAIADPAALQRIAEQLAGFLHELHHLPLDQIVPATQPVGDTRPEWVALYERFRARLFGYMRADARRQVEDHFREFLAHPQRYVFTPALRHGDFGAGNILYDPHRLSVQGIIDFGAAGPGDPAIDFAGLYICYGEAFYTRCAARYAQMAQALPRVRFYCGTFALQEALFGLENRDPEAFQSGMAGYV